MTALEHCDLTGARCGPDAVWSREIVRDFMWDREVTPVKDDMTHGWAIQIGRIRSVAHFARHLDEAHYFVVPYERGTKRLERYGSYWPLSKLIVAIDVTP